MFELSGVNYEEVLEQGDSILVRVIASSSYRGSRYRDYIVYPFLKLLSQKNAMIFANAIYVNSTSVT